MRSYKSFLGLGLGVFGFLGLVGAGLSCREVVGQCSGKTDTLCLEIALQNPTPVPQYLQLSLSAPGVDPHMMTFDAGTTLKDRPYYIEVALTSPNIDTLDIDVTGSTTVAVAAAHQTVMPKSAARPTRIVLLPVESPSDLGEDLSSPADMRSVPLDLTTPTGWTKVHTSTGARLYAITGIAGTPNAIYASGGLGTVIKGDGTLFAKTAGTIASCNDVLALWPLTGLEVWAGCQSGRVFQTVDSGTNWMDKMSGGINPQNAIFGLSTVDVFVAGQDNNKGYFWNGAAWSTPSHNLNRAVNGLWRSATTAFIVGQAGRSAKAPMPTGTWTQLPQVATGDLSAVTGIDDANIWTVDDKGNLFAYNPATVQWDVVANMNNWMLKAIWARSTNDVWIAGVTGGGDGVVAQCSISGKGCTTRSNSNLAGYTVTGIWGDTSGGIWLSAWRFSDGAIFKY